MHLFNVDPDPDQGRPKRPPDQEKKSEFIVFEERDVLYGGLIAALP